MKPVIFTVWRSKTNRRFYGNIAHGSDIVAAFRGGRGGGYSRKSSLIKVIKSVVASILEGSVVLKQK